MGSLEKHVGNRKNEKGVKVVDVKCAHAKNETKFVSINHPFVFEQIQSGFEGKNKMKVIQFAYISCFLPKESP